MTTANVSPGRKVARIASAVLIYLVAVDVAAVLLLFLLDIVYSGFTSGGLSYAVWFVAGVRPRRCPRADRIRT